MENLAQQIVGLLTPRNWSKDLGLKLVSLFFAVFLWYFVVGEDKVDMNLLVPIEIVNLPRDLVISNQYKKELDVTVSGSRSLIRSLSRRELTRTVDLSKAEPGTMIIRNTPDSISLPRGIRVLRIQPTHLVFTIDRLIEKNLTVKPSITGTPAPGHRIARVRLEPDSIHLTGPQTLLGPIPFLATIPIDVTGLDRTTTVETRLDLTPELAELIGESLVTARLEVRQEYTTRTIEDLTPRIVNRRDGFAYLLTPPTVTCELRFPAALPTNDPTTLVKLSVDVDNLPPGRHVIPVDGKAGADIAVLAIRPSEVQVDISPIIAPARPLKIKKGTTEGGQQFPGEKQQ